MQNKIKGLSELEVRHLQELYGKNELTKEKKESLLKKILFILSEPMFLLLLVASIIYFLLGEAKDGIVMLVFVVFMIGIDVIQELKTDKTLQALKDLSNPKIFVIRDNLKKEISSTNLVVGDIMLIHEGVKIPADGKILKMSGLQVDESSLTGESTTVYKTNHEEKNNNYFKNNMVYASTLVVAGTAVVLVTSIANDTEYGKIGKNVNDVVTSKSPLQKQTDKLVKTSAIIAFVLFGFVMLFTFFDLSDHTLKLRIIESILAGITLAMAMIPEEFPVVLTVFLSMGAWRLAKKHSLVKKLSSVETLGQVSVLCVDKTGTITKNKMEVKEVFTNEKEKLCKLLRLSCGALIYDPMEQAIVKYCEDNNITKESIKHLKKEKEYNFSNDTKIMGNIWGDDGKLILSVKGSPEGVIKLCHLKASEEKVLTTKIEKMSNAGLRVIAVAFKDINKNEIQEEVTNYKLDFCGLIGLVDPPKDNIKEDIKRCNEAGIRVVMITGDNGITASSIAKSVGIKNTDNIITGEELNKLSNEQLKKKIKEVNIFSRVVPTDKYKIIKAFKENGEVVAMTGDGVNDAAALKYADIGIAMGKRGSEVSREAADLILMDDNFKTIVDTVKDGRKIYDNIKKSVSYIITIHVPIALSSLFAPLLGISQSNFLLLPLHVVLLELVIDPTCSIIFERQPASDDIMQKKPRASKESIVTKSSLFKSIMQGIIIFIASFASYFYFLNNNMVSSNTARSIGLTIIILANIFLVIVNSSDTEFAFISIKKLFKDKVIVGANIIIIGCILIALYSNLNKFLKLGPLTIKELLYTIIISFIAVFWYEIVKIFKTK